MASQLPPIGFQKSFSSSLEGRTKPLNLEKPITILLGFFARLPEERVRLKTPRPKNASAIDFIVSKLKSFTNR